MSEPTSFDTRAMSAIDSLRTLLIRRFVFRTGHMVRAIGASNDEGRNSHFASAISRRMPILLLISFLVHNGEEALTYPIYRQQSQALVREHFAAGFVGPSASSFHGTLILVSLAAICAMIFASLHRQDAMARSLLRALAWVMLLNVLAPHAPAAFLMGGYSPGLITALILNLPISAYVLLCTRWKPPTR